MHEMSLVHEVLNIVLKSTKGTPIKAVSEVHLTIGEARDVVEDYMNGLFNHLARGTVAENAKLVINRVPYTVRCADCGEVFRMNIRDRSTWVCPHCGAQRRYYLNTGMEFRVDSVQVANIEQGAA